MNHEFTTKKIALVLVVLLSLGLLIFIVSKKRSLLTSDTGPQPAIILRTVPSGAEVIVDGKNLGQSPLVIKYQKYRKINLVVKHPGYLDHAQELDGETFKNIGAIVLQAESKGKKKGF